MSHSPCIGTTRRAHTSRTDEEDEATPLSHPHPDLGVIEVAMRKVDHYTKSERTFKGSGKVVEVGPVNERSKKAGAHAIS